MDTGARVNFGASFEPAQSEPQQVGLSQNSQTGSIPRTPQVLGTLATNTSFPISSLGISRARPQTPKSYPSPPPEDYDDDDAMDVDTPNKTWIPQSLSLVQQQPLIPGPEPTPSPFYGHLPEAPIGPAHRLRNPPNKPSFRKTPAAQQETFFRNVTRRHSIADSDIDSVEARPLTPWALQEPKFFAGPQDTGLEQAFGGIFSLKDDPQGLGLSAQLSQSATAQPTGQRPWARSKRVLSIMSLILACLAWSQSSTYAYSAWPIQYATFGTTAIIAGQRLLQSLHPDRPVWILSDILIFTVELTAAASLGYISRTALLDGFPIQDTLGSLPLLFSIGMLLQEATTLHKEFRTPHRPAASEPAAPKAKGAHPANLPPQNTTARAPAPAPAPVRPPTAPARHRAETPTPQVPPSAARPFTRSQRRASPASALGGLSLGDMAMALEDSPMKARTGGAAAQGAGAARSLRSRTGGSRF